MGFLEEIRGHKREVSMLIERRMELLNRVWIREQAIATEQYYKHDWAGELREITELSDVTYRLMELGIADSTNLSHQQL